MLSKELSPVSEEEDWLLDEMWAAMDSPDGLAEAGLELVGDEEEVDEDE